MLRIIAIILIIFLIVWLIRRSTIAAYKSSREPKKEHQATDNSPENMVNCAVCNVHFPKGESILYQEKYYCSEAHFQQRKV